MIDGGALLLSAVVMMCMYCVGPARTEKARHFGRLNRKWREQQNERNNTCPTRSLEGRK